MNTLCTNLNTKLWIRDHFWTAKLPTLHRSKNKWPDTHHKRVCKNQNPYITAVKRYDCAFLCFLVLTHVVPKWLQYPLLKNVMLMHLGTRIHDSWHSKRLLTFRGELFRYASPASVSHSTCKPVDLTRCHCRLTWLLSRSTVTNVNVFVFLCRLVVVHGSL